MKKYISLIIMFLFVYLSSNAQTRNGFGIHAGVNTCWIYDLEDGLDDDYDATSSYQVGVRYNAKLGPIGFSPEVNYTNMQATASTNTTTINQEFNYISIPLLLKFYILGFNVHFGAQTSYLLGGKSNITAETANGITNIDNRPLTDETFYYTALDGTKYWAYNEIDVAGILGVGLDTKMGLYASLRSVFSLSPIENVNSLNASLLDQGLPELPTDVIEEWSRWASIQLLVGYKF